MNDLEELSQHKRQIDAAENALSDFIAKRWPPGSPITWMRGGNLQYGEVIHTGLGSVRVRNERSGASYWIDIYWVKEALRALALPQADGKARA